MQFCKEILMKMYLKTIFFAFISVIFMMVSITLATTVILNFRPLYYNHINDFVKNSNLNYEQIKENYDALIDYNSFWGSDKLEFPHLPSSANGITHFEEVKTIFLEFQLALIIGVIVLILLIPLYQRLYHSYEYLLAGGMATIFIPFSLAVFIYANFNKIFILFHQIAFNNDYWIFDYRTDPIIKYLPQEFFMLCAIGISVLVFLFGIIMLVLYYKQHRRTKHSLN